MPKISTKEEVGAGSEMGIPVGVVVARLEGEIDHLMFEPQEPNIIDGLAEFLDFPEDQEMFIIPDEQALAVLLDLSENIPEKITKPLLLTDRFRASFLQNSAKDILDGKTT